jgi:hypothetical protein
MGEKMTIKLKIVEYQQAQEVSFCVWFWECDRLVYKIPCLG